jgi:fructose-1,6-bisphosphatase/inositol monophosphatase family enzyme
VAAAGLIAEEAGALVTNMDGQPDYISAPQSIIAAAPGIHAELMSALHQG